VNDSLSSIVLPLQKRVESVLREILPEQSKKTAYLAEAMKYAVLSPGKRIRPVLTYLTGETLNVPKHLLDRPAAAVELIHAYSLIHDDLPAMDDDDLRRGRPTCHKKFDEATAILAGDALQALAFEILTNEKSDKDSSCKNLKIINVLATASGLSGMVGGQSVDLRSEGKIVSESHLEQMHAMKTGALINASVMSAFHLSNEKSNLIRDALETFSNSIGLAFQVQDDILDVEGDTSIIGKPQGSDTHLDKSTYPQIMGLEEAKNKANQLINDALDSLKIFGSRGQKLSELAQYIINRNK